MAIRISIPGQAGVTEGYVSAPNDSATTIGGFSYPDDGSIVTSGSITPQRDERERVADGDRRRVGGDHRHQHLRR